MRLLDIWTKKLESFTEEDAPKYVILSHTWGRDEVTFQDLQNDPASYTSKAGWTKINGLCEILFSNSRYSDIRYVWVDTCCIDKSSSAELQEAINSMFRWYRNSWFCVVYLEDVRPIDSSKVSSHDISNSRWLSRGWTLQELLAPKVVLFYDSTWHEIHSLSDWMTAMKVISEVTGIPLKLLPSKSLRYGRIRSSRLKPDRIMDISVAERLSWAALRQTTRSEDRAYSLLGIMGIHMPMLYGEGDAAFSRLQTELIKSSAGQSFLAYGFGMSLNFETYTTVLAKSPAVFQGCRAVSERAWTSEEALLPFDMTNTGLRISMPLIQIQHTTIAFLRCTLGKGVVAIPLQKSRTGKNGYTRVLGGLPTLVSQSLAPYATLQDVFLHDVVRLEGFKLEHSWALALYSLVLPTVGHALVEVYPPRTLQGLYKGSDSLIPSETCSHAVFKTPQGGSFMFALRFEANSLVKVPTRTRIFFRVEGRKPPVPDAGKSHEVAQSSVTKVALLGVGDESLIQDREDEVLSLLDYNMRTTLAPPSQELLQWHDSVDILNHRISLRIGKAVLGYSPLEVTHEFLEQ